MIGGQREDTVQMIALDPVLQLARRIAGVLADLEHGDHDNLDWNASRRRDGW
jgi:hypothetical protein